MKRLIPKERFAVCEVMTSSVANSDDTLTLQKTIHIEHHTVLFEMVKYWGVNNSTCVICKPMFDDTRYSFIHDCI